MHRKWRCFRFGMVKLQRDSARVKLKEQKFPLWHGKVATTSVFVDSMSSREFPLWHGKVATQRWWRLRETCQRFRFGMVKLQQQTAKKPLSSHIVSALAW